jgi:hypothetical protein
MAARLFAVGRLAVLNGHNETFKRTKRDIKWAT